MKKSLSLLSCNTTQKTMESPRHTRRHMLRAAICRALFPLGLLLLAMPAFGQTYVGNASNCIGTITRSNDNGTKRMHYVKDGPTSGCFLSGLTSSGNQTYFGSHTISGYDIKDFTVFNDTLYICGQDADGDGFYGWARPTGVTWTFYMYKLRNSAINISKIRVFRSGQDLHVLLVGTYCINMFLSYRSVFHVKNNSICTVAYHVDEYFEDIAVLGNYVVTIARKGARDLLHEPHYLRVLHKNLFTLGDTLFDNYYAWHHGTESVGSVRLQATGADRFVSVFCRDSAYYINAYTVDSNGLLTHHKKYTIPTGTPPTIGDVAYNSTDSMLVILHNIDTVGTAAFYNCTSFPNMTLSNSQYPDISFNQGPKLLSVTRRPTSNFVISGICQNRFVYWDTRTCEMRRELFATSSSAGDGRLTWAPTRDTIYMRQRTYASPSGMYPVEPDCAGLNLEPTSSGDNEEND